MYRLLFAEDEKATREGILSGIPWQNLGISEVRAARNGAAALELLTEFEPDILLTDIKMPKMNGIELATRIRKSFPDCSILLISGYSDREYLRSAIYLKAVDFVEKPLRIPELTDQLVRAVQEQNAIRKQKQLLSEELRALLPEKEEEQDSEGAFVSLPTLNPALDIDSDAFLQRHLQAVYASVSDTMDKTDPLVLDILDIIHSQYMDRTLSLDSISRQLYLSAAYLCVRFKKAMDVSPVHYINQYRIKASLPFLKDESQKLDEIGQKVGIENGNYYSKVFKKYMGCSPAQYRKSIGSKEQCQAPSLHCDQ